MVSGLLATGGEDGYVVFWKIQDWVASCGEGEGGVRQGGEEEEGEGLELKWKTRKREAEGACCKQFSSVCPWQTLSYIVYTLSIWPFQ